MDKLDPNIRYINGSKKGVRITKMKDTIIEGEDKKVSQGKYSEKLQVINDRIRSYRPITIKNYKPSIEAEFEAQNKQLSEWDGQTWDYGEYPEFLRKKGVKFPEGLQSGPLNKECNAQLFADFKVLVKSAAVLRGYNHPSRVRGGTYEDVDDFFNFTTINLCERRLKQYDINSPCRIWQNWPSYLAVMIPQYLTAFNKSKFDFDVEAYWPHIKDKSTGEYQPIDFGKVDKLAPELVSKEVFFKIFSEIVQRIPEASGLYVDILFYLIWGFNLNNKKLVKVISNIVKMQLAEAEVDEIL